MSEHQEHQEEDKLHPIQQPQRSRAVFSQEDFDLIRTAIAHYLQEIRDNPEASKEASKYSNLYHRLGRVG
ncbi:putative Zn-dependent peptidase [Pseudochelatococcus lubricantis]|uniref:Zn-dependent peptidase n=1 Tax=Pseudochelatococcus lubricantis TaxID=1538102 RepID=A0ABX0V5F3_9HYPH|nr:hypothetical protein [Pseudochelatococcus lubricantis]NIJ59729.1 putative Zn-dependent peptidase [Pseudochelatococcus lubricantis]